MHGFFSSYPEESFTLQKGPLAREVGRLGGKTVSSLKAINEEFQHHNHRE